MRGFRIELEAVEAVLKEYKPPLKQLAVVAVKEPRGNELVAFVAAAALEGRGGGLGLLEHCEARLPKYMVPSKVVALAAFPCLPNGKLNLTALASGAATGEVVESQADAAAKAGKQTATDSLGMVRELASGDGRQSPLELETQVADVLRALFMYGVIVDHWSDCGDEPGQACWIVNTYIVGGPGGGSDGGAAGVWALLNQAWRLIGNYKDMSGFIMISAYADARFAHAALLSKQDVIVLFLYLEMIWVLDPISQAVGSRVNPSQFHDQVNPLVRPSPRLRTARTDRRWQIRAVAA